MASTILTRSATGATSITEATISAWIKRSTLGSRVIFNSAYLDGSAYYFRIQFDPNNFLEIENYDNATNLYLKPNQVFRDVSAWYHIVVRLSLTETGNDRCKLYINGEQVTSFASQIAMTGDQFLVGKNNYTVRVGSNTSASANFDGSMAHVHFIDGTAYDADTFGETDATTGIWKPKTAPSVIYGTNGFFLKGENSGSLGTDSSGNANNFTVNGTPTQTIDTPSNVFCTMNPLYKWDYNLAITNGNTSVNGTQSQWQGSCGTLGITKGKYYFEYKFTSATDINNYYVGFMSLDNYKTSEPFRNGIHYYNFDGGEVFASNTSTFTNTTADYGTGVNGDIFGIALDYDNSLFSVYKNGTALVTNHDFSASVSTAKGGNTVTPVIGHFGTGSVAFNFGNGFFGTTAVASAQNPDDGIGIFEYDVPANYRALCTKSINAQEYS